MVECNLAKVEVAGSNPVSRSTYKKIGIVLGSLKQSDEVFRSLKSLANKLDFRLFLCSFYSVLVHNVLIKPYPIQVSWGYKWGYKLYPHLQYAVYTPNIKFLVVILVCYAIIAIMNT